MHECLSGAFFSGEENDISPPLIFGHFPNIAPLSPALVVTLSPVGTSRGGREGRAFHIYMVFFFLRLECT